MVTVSSYHTSVDTKDAYKISVEQHACLECFFLFLYTHTSRTRISY